MEKLRKYLKSNKLKQNEFAESIGATTSTISRVLNGEHLPDLKLAVTIQRKTNGFVRCEDWVK